MTTKNAYLFLEKQYLNLPITQEILDERSSEMEPLVTGQDNDGIDIIEERTPQNTTILDALEAYQPLKASPVGNSPIKYYWFNGVDAPTEVEPDQDAPLDENGDPITGGKVFLVAGLHNFTFDESNSMKASMDSLQDQATADALGVDIPANNFHPWLSHKQALDFIRNGNLPA